MYKCTRIQQLEPSLTLLNQYYDQLYEINLYTSFNVVLVGSVRTNTKIARMALEFCLALLRFGIF